MSTPMPPNEPLDAQEREFARILRALPAGGAEPPPALDAAVLRAANNAAAASRRPGAKLLASAGALWGIGSAAAAVLALGVVWQMKYGAPDRAPAAASAPAAQVVSDREEDEAVPVDFDAYRGDAPASAPPPMAKPAEQPQAPGRVLERAPMAAAAPPPPPPAPEPYPADHLDEHVARDAVVASEMQAEAAAGAAAANDQAQRADTREREAGYAAAKSAPAPAAPPATSADSSELSKISAVGGLAEPRQEAAPVKPATWLAEIRRLRDAGKLAEARAKLVEFRRAYPNWVIPTDLAPLLSE